MITLKYYKKDKAVYLSHIDVLRHMNRTFRRAGIAVEFSQGFNPHMLTKLGIPLPLATYSSCEYVTVQTDENPDEFLKKYNAACVKGLEGIRAFEVSKNPNLAGAVAYADYSIKANPQGKEKEINDIINRKSFVVDYPTRKEPDKKRDIIPDMVAIRCYPDSINVCINAVNMRADVLATSFGRAFGIPTDKNEIWRYCQYVRVNGVLTPVDDYLESLAKNEK